MEEYISNKELKTLLEDIQLKIQSDKLNECKEMLVKLVEDAENGEKYIDRTYIGEVKARKRKFKIAEIHNLLEEMSIEQIENVYVYVENEHNEPNHEAEALNAVVKLSQKMQSIAGGVK